MGDKIIVHTNGQQYFFSTARCQPTSPEEFVSITCDLPYRTEQREIIPSGVIRTREEFVKVFHSDEEEIPNPDPNYQV